ncbi:MAG: hypothetical protein U0075_13395 [Thermomicrobiales bacterium]
MSITEAGRSVDARHFDALAKTLSVPDSRRRLLALLATLPILGGLLILHPDDDAEAKERRRRRKQRHKKRKSPGKRKGKRKGKRNKQKACTPEPVAQTCAGKCGSVTNNCRKAVDCGACTCSPACETCFTCQGAPGSCVPQQAGTPCGDPATCENGTLQPRGSCGGSGACEPAAPVSCAPYTGCAGDVCASSCTSDNDCVAGSFCNASQCVGDRANGESCGNGGQCASGFCVNDVCCDTTCDGACEACDLGGSAGTCTTVANGTACGGDNICCAGSCQECCTNAQCDNPAAPVCDGGTCTACTASSQCASSEVCCGGSCVDGICCANSDCDDPGAPDCVGHACVCPSNGEIPCVGGEICCDAGSFDLETDDAHCGACDVACDAGLTCCGGDCVDRQTDPLHCGACGNDCGANAICVDGVCQACDVTCTGSAEDCGAALQAALSGSKATIYVCPGTYRGGFTIGRPVTVIGAGQGDDPTRDTILHGGGTQQVLIGNTGLVFPPVLRRLHITGGFINFTRGGGIWVIGSLTMEDCTVADNRGGSGAGIHCPHGDLVMTRCTVRNNHPPADAFYESWGGGLHAYRSVLTDCTITDNSSDLGGGIFALPSSHTLLGKTVVAGNTAKWGGGIWTDLINDVSLTIGEECRITGNTALPGQGGGILAPSSESVFLLGTADPSPIVTDNCHENCAGNVPKCAATPVSCPA